MISRKKIADQSNTPSNFTKSYSWFEDSSGFLFIGRDQISQDDENIHFIKVTITRPLLLNKCMLRTQFSTVLYILMDILKQRSTRSMSYEIST